MTKEYALHLLNQLMIGASVDAKPIIPQYELAQALDLAIKALEQQPCDDCISRQAALDTIGNVPDYDDGMVWEALSHAQRDVALLPSVTPKYTDEEIDKAQAVEQAYVDKMVELAVEEAKRPKGKWIKIQSGDKDFPESIVCSRCKNENSHLDFDEHSVPIGKVFVTSKYCPNCGAEMSGGGEDEDR